MRSVAARASHKHLVLHHQRRGRNVAAALPRVIDVDLPNQAPGLLVQAHHVVVFRPKEDLAVAHGQSPIADKTGHVSRHLGILVVPDFAPRRGVQREHVCPGRDQVHHAAHYDGRRLQVLRVVARLEHPDRRQGLDVGGVDLIQGAVPPRELGSPIVRPIGPRGPGILRQRQRRRNREQDQGESHCDHDSEFLGCVKGPDTPRAGLPLTRRSKVATPK